MAKSTDTDLVETLQLASRGSKGRKRVLQSKPKFRVEVGVEDGLGGAVYPELFAAVCSEVSDAQGP